MGTIYLCCIQWAITPGMRYVSVLKKHHALANKLECYLNSNHMKYLGSSFIVYIMLLYGLHVHAYVNILTK